MRQKINILSIIFIFLSLSVFSQTYSTKKKKAIEQFELARRNYDMGNLKDAETNLNKAIKIDKKFMEAYLLKAQLYFEIGNYKKEAEIYECALEINPNFSPKVYYLIAVSYFNSEEYKKSAEKAQEGLDMSPSSHQLQILLEKVLEGAKFAQNLYEHPVPFEPINMGKNINTQYDDYWPMLSVDGKKLYTTKNIPKNNSYPYSRRNSNEDFFINIKNNDGTWSRTQNMGAPLNTIHNEGAPTISADGQTFVFTACNRKDGYGKCDLYISHKQNGIWTTPRNIGKDINTKYLERQPSISADGKTLYFTSDRPGTDGKEDIWISHLQNDGHWSKPINLGKDINTDGIEWAPFIHLDGKTLYFVSSGHLGMGGLDIFKATKINDTTWTKPMNLGYPINTVYNEQSLFVSRDGKIGLFASDRAEDDNGLDIYSFDLYPEARPTYVSYAKGIITDAKTGRAIEATINLIDLKSSNKIAAPNSNASTGEYILCLPSERNYMMNISKKGYLPYSEHFALEKTHEQKPLTMNIKLQPIEINARVVLKNIFFELDSYELKPESKIELAKLIQFLETNPTVSIEISGHTDNQGSKEHNKVLSKNRAKTVYNYLIKHKIAAARLSYKGFGFEQPIATNDSKEGRALNRRTEFKITKL